MRLIRGDALEVMPTLGEGAVDAVIVDPPYGIGYTTGRTPSCSWHDQPIDGDRTTEVRDAVVAWAESRALPWACFGTWKVSCPRGVRGVLVWDKGPAFGMGDLSFPWKPSWELIYVGGKGWRGKREEGVLRGSPVVSWESRGRVHPMQKPTWLIGALLAKLPRQGTVLDPCMGSGSTIVACVERGFDFVGIESDPHWYAVAERRVKAARQAVASEAAFFGAAPELF